MKTNVVVTCQFEGFHNWPDAPDNVAFLRHSHRHVFFVSAKKTVCHDNREIEIIKLKRSILGYINSAYPGGMLGAKSCEMLARELMEKFKLFYCSVLEDNENGGEIWAN